MTSTEHQDANESSLRHQAEKALEARKHTPDDAVARDDVMALIHELEVHQIELEMQNEELLGARAALESARDRYADLYDFSPVARATLDSQGIMLDANLTLCALLGMERSRLQGEAFSRFLAPESQDPFHLFMQRLCRDGDSDAITVAMTTASGQDAQIQVQAIALNEKSGVVVRLAITDITQRVQAEAALRESEQRFKSLVESSPMGIHMYDLQEDGQLIFRGANPAADRILRVSNSSFIGMPIEDVFPALAGSEVPDRYRRAARDGESWETERIDFEDDRIVGAFKIYAFQTQPGRMVAMFLDVTNERVIHQENQLLEVQLHHAQRLKSIGTLASGVAHEVNNPLMGMMNYAELIQDCVADDSRAHGYASEIIGEGNRIARIVRNLLSYSRPDEAELEVCELGDIIETSLSLLRSSLLRAGIAIHIELESGLPPVCCEPQQMQQVLVNLITNSQHALSKRYPEFDDDKKMIISAESVRHTDTNWVRIVVEDHGTGIGESEKEYIFDPFATGKSRAIGTGLGLWVTHRLITDHGGTVKCVSTPGEFTRMVIDLPAATAVAE